MFRALLDLSRALKDGDIIAECNYLCFTIRENDKSCLPTNRDFIDYYWCDENQKRLDMIEEAENIAIVRGVFAYRFHPSWDWEGFEPDYYKLCHIPFDTENCSSYYLNDCANFYSQSLNSIDLQSLIELKENKLVDIIRFTYQRKVTTFLRIPVISLSILDFVDEDAINKLHLAAKRMSRVYPVFVLDKANIFGNCCNVSRLYHKGKSLPLYHDFYEHIKNYIADIDIYAYGVIESEFLNYLNSYKESTDKEPRIIITHQDTSYKSIRNRMEYNFCMLRYTRNFDLADHYFIITERLSPKEHKKLEERFLSSQVEEATETVEKCATANSYSPKYNIKPSDHYPVFSSIQTAQLELYRSNSKLFDNQLIFVTDECMFYKVDMSEKSFTAIFSCFGSTTATDKHIDDLANTQVDLGRLMETYNASSCIQQHINELIGQPSDIDHTKVVLEEIIEYLNSFPEWTAQTTQQ